MPGSASSELYGAQAILMYFVEVICKNLIRRKTRTGLTLAGLGVAVAASTLLLSISDNYTQAATRYYTARDVDLVVVRAGVADRLNSSLHSDLAQALERLPGVAAVDGTLTEMVSLQEGGGWIGVPLHGYSFEGFALSCLNVTAGRRWQESDRHVCLVGSGLARSLDKRPGDVLEIEGITFRVVGVFAATNPLEANTLAAPLTDVQELMDRPGQVSEFQIQVNQDAASETEQRNLGRRIETLLDDSGRPLGFKASLTHDFVQAGTESRLARSMAWGTSLLAVSLSGIGMMNTMLMSVLERTRELGVVRAIGWPRERVMRMVLGEALILSSLGGVFGVLLATGIIRLLGGWSMTGHFVAPYLSAGAILWGAGLAVVAGLGGAAYPAWSAASIPALEALRYE